MEDRHQAVVGQAVSALRFCHVRPPKSVHARGHPSVAVRGRITKSPIMKWSCGNRCSSGDSSRKSSDSTIEIAICTCDARRVSVSKSCLNLSFISIARESQLCVFFQMRPLVAISAPFVCDTGPFTITSSQLNETVATSAVSCVL